MSTTSQENNVNPSETAVAVSEKPAGWIRWSGVITVLALVSIVVGGGYVLGSWGLKNQLEKTASEAWGAQVDIGSIGLSLSPLAIEVRELAITDPDQPMQNLLNIERIHLAVNLYHLVVGRFVMEEVDISGLALNQPRKTSGEIVRKQAEKPVEKPKQQDQSKSFMPSFDLPKAEDVLARETLQTVEQANKVEQELKQLEQEWAQAQANLPTEASIRAYQQELETLFKGPFKDLADIQQRHKRLVELQKQISADQKAIETAHKVLNDGIKQVRQDVTYLQKLPNEDLQRLLSTYSLDQSGLANVTYLLFGEKVQQPLQMALDWYQKAQPLLAWLAEYQQEQAAAKAVKPARAFGEYVQFVEFDPQPDFIIKQLRFNGALDWGRIEADVKDINFDHAQSLKPVRFVIQAQPNSRDMPLVFKGFSSALEGDQVLTRADITWPSYVVKDWLVSDNDSLPLSLKSAMTDISGQINLFGLSRSDSYLDLNYRQVEFDLSASKSADVKRYIAPAFKDIDQFSVNTRLTGRLTSPTVDIGSDLDRKLSQAFDAVYQQQLKVFKQDLERQLNAKLDAVKAPIESELKRLGVDQNKLSEQQKQLQAWLSEDADGKAKKAQTDLQKQLNDQANQRLKEEKKKAEAEAKKRLEQELKRNLKLPF